MESSRRFVSVLVPKTLFTSQLISIHWILPVSLAIYYFEFHWNIIHWELTKFSSCTRHRNSRNWRLVYSWAENYHPRPWWTQLHWCRHCRSCASLWHKCWTHHNVWNIPRCFTDECARISSWQSVIKGRRRCSVWGSHYYGEERPSFNWWCTQNWALVVQWMALTDWDPGLSSHSGSVMDGMLLVVWSWFSGGGGVIFL